jgi:two-component system, OmpR family, response regulator
MNQTQKTVLLVDDDEDLILQMKLQFEAAGYHVATAGSDSQGRERIDAVPPDIAVVDLMMEEHDSGFALCHFIKQRAPSIPIILLTAVASETGIDFDAVTAEERTWIKADLLLDKPVRFETLQAEVSRLLN